MLRKYLFFQHVISVLSRFYGLQRTKNDIIIKFLLLTCNMNKPLINGLLNVNSKLMQ